MAAVPEGHAAAVPSRLAQPESEATRLLYERHHRKILAFCRHQLGSREEAEDATQITFLNAFRGLKRGTSPDFETAWLFKIAHNVCLTKQRNSYRRRLVEAPSDLELIEQRVPAHQADSDELFGLQTALRVLPEQQRRALLLREWQGLSYKEIGDAMQLSQPAVETLIFRARRSLAEALTTDPALKRKRGRPRTTSNLGSSLAALKSLLLGGSIKVATTVATVAATSVVAATPAVRNDIVDAVVHPRTLWNPAPAAQHVAPALTGGIPQPVVLRSAEPARPAAVALVTTRHRQVVGRRIVRKEAPNLEPGSSATPQTAIRPQASTAASIATPAAPKATPTPTPAQTAPAATPAASVTLSPAAADPDPSWPAPVAPAAAAPSPSAQPATPAPAVTTPAPAATDPAGTAATPSTATPATGTTAATAGTPAATTQKGPIVVATPPATTTPTTTTPTTTTPTTTTPAPTTTTPTTTPTPTTTTTTPTTTTSTSTPPPATQGDGTHHVVGFFVPE